MPLIIEGGRVPTLWAEQKSNCSPLSASSGGRQRGALRLAFINNMPDGALDDTELQFFGLLDSASGTTPVYIKLYSLTGVPRGERGLQHLRNFYLDFDDLWKSRFDAAIITGTEPRESNLRNEPYWKLLGEVFDWAARETVSTIMSCLAAHASVLHNDGISRHRLSDKQCGVFESHRGTNHALTDEISGIVRFPHSRWNEVRESDLVSAGYSIVTKSKEAGVDLFVRKNRSSLFVHFQGHPEYNADTLLKEYRRDIKRFLRGERETYPTMPRGYFDQSATRLLNELREGLMVEKAEWALDSVFESASAGLQNTWKAPALGIYKNWLSYLESRKCEAQAAIAFSRIRPQAYRILGNEIG
jgi:homoserine O-succinyltransferase